jgi:hypothetical protein
MSHVVRHSRLNHVFGAPEVDGAVFGSCSCQAGHNARDVINDLGTGQSPLDNSAVTYITFHDGHTLALERCSVGRGMNECLEHAAVLDEPFDKPTSQETCRTRYGNSHGAPTSRRRWVH